MPGRVHSMHRMVSWCVERVPYNLLPIGPVQS